MLVNFINYRLRQIYTLSTLICQCLEGLPKMKSECPRVSTGGRKDVLTSIEFLRKPREKEQQDEWFCYDDKVSASHQQENQHVLPAPILAMAPAGVKRLSSALETPDPGIGLVECGDCLDRKCRDQPNQCVSSPSCWIKKREPSANASASGIWKRKPSGAVLVGTWWSPPVLDHCWAG
jgi:hypothetical protein